MTLEDKLLDRLEKLAKIVQSQDTNEMHMRLKRASLHQEVAVKEAIIKELQTRLAQVESAHTQLLKYTKELESKLSRKGKRGK
jgi:hypothetical protein